MHPPRVCLIWATSKDESYLKILFLSGIAPSKRFGEKIPQILLFSVMNTRTSMYIWFRDMSNQFNTCEKFLEIQIQEKITLHTNVNLSLVIILLLLLHNYKTPYHKKNLNNCWDFLDLHGSSRNVSFSLLQPTTTSVLRKTNTLPQVLNSWSKGLLTPRIAIRAIWIITCAIIVITSDFITTRIQKIHGAEIVFIDILLIWEYRYLKRLLLIYKV